MPDIATISSQDTGLAERIANDAPVSATCTDTEPCSATDLQEVLSERLAEEGVSYCVWKRTIELDSPLLANKELDLLVSRGDGQRFQEILIELGFKEGRPSISEELPGMVHYYGCSKAGWLHLHVHFQLLIGHDLTKNYRLPLEQVFLSSSRRRGLWRIPTPECELIGLVLRMVLKHLTWDAFLFGQGTLPKAVQDELAFLMARATLASLRRLLSDNLPVLDPMLFDACLTSLQPHSATRFRMRTARKLTRRMKPYARRSAGAEIVTNFYHLTTRAVRRRLWKQLPRKRLLNGGAVIALVGGDGAGKSTAVAALATWLSKHFETRTVHLGRPPRSGLTWLVKGFVRLARLSRFLSTEKKLGKSASIKLTEYCRLLECLCTARDRFRTFRRACRFASNGGLVFCDRFPLAQLRLMDGPRSNVSEETFRHFDKLMKLLVQQEISYYRAFTSPDLLVVLRVNPNIAVLRKVDEDASAVEQRCQEVWNTSWEQSCAHVIDANQPATDVMMELQHLVWAEL